MAIKRGTSGRNIITGTNGADRLYGLGGDDVLYGRGGNDKLYGGGGDDILVGGRGADKLYGGSGKDMASYAKASGHVNVDLTTGGSPGGGEATGDKFNSIEGVIGSRYNDFINGSARVDRIEGGGGDDVIRLGDGNDTVLGGSGNDYIDMIGGGSDKIDGGSGKDTVYFNSATSGVWVFLGTGSTKVSGYWGAAGDTFKNVESVWGSDYGDALRAGSGGTAYGNPGNDVIHDALGTATTELLVGGSGADVLDDRYGLGADYFVLEGGGADSIYGFDPLYEGDRIGLMGFAPNSSQIINALDNQATIAGTQLIYETDTNTLWYDYDGIGGYGPEAIAVLDAASSTVTQLFASYFVRIDMW